MSSPSASPGCDGRSVEGRAAFFDLERETNKLLVKTDSETNRIPLTAGDYAKRFKQRFNYEPPYQAAESSASVLTFVDAFQRAGSLDKEKVRDALAKTDLETFYGPIKFDSTGKKAEATPAGGK